MSVLFIFASSPHGSARGREGLDALLAMSAFTQDIDVLFMADGVYQILRGQQPAGVLSRDHARTFGVLELYDITRIYVQESELVKRKLSPDQLLLASRPLSDEDCRLMIARADAKLVF